MKFKINAKAFREEIAEAAAFAQSGIGMDGCVCLELAGGTLSIKTKSQRSGYIGSMQVTGVEDGSAIVRIDKLNIILGSLPDKETEFSIKDDNLIIKQNGIHFKLKDRTDDGHFKSEIPTSWQKIPEFFADAVSRTAYATSKDVTKIQFSGIFVECAGEKMNFVATDGRRLSIVSDKYDGKPGNLLIPAWFMTQMAKRPVTEFMMEKNVVWFKAGEKYYSSAIISKEFPSYQRVIPVQTDYSEITVSKDVMEDSVSRVSLVSDKNTKKIMIMVKNRKMTISATSQDGTATEVIDVNCADDVANTFYVNSKYLIDAIGCAKAKNLAIAFKPGLCPVVIKDDECKGWSAIVMPMNGD